MSTSLNLSISLRHQGKSKSFWAYACLFCLGQTYEFETQAHALSFLCGSSYPSDGTCMKRQRRGVHFHPPPVIWPLPKSPVLTAAHFSARPTHCLLGLSSPRVSFSQTHLCVSLSPSHSYDLGVRVAPTPSPTLDWVTLPLLSRSPCEGAPCQA